MEKRNRSCKIVGRRMRDGFSLVEIIIAITVLAVLAVPILAYFSNAATSTSRGKDTQRAGMAAQTVTEELNSCLNFEQIEDELIAAAGSAWTLDKKASGSDRSSELTKKVTVDGIPYQVKVKVNYDDYDNDTDRYNKYATPELKEVYSPENVVIAESDQADIAASSFLYFYPSDKAADIKKEMKRTLCLGIDMDSDIYSVRAYYKYKYKTKELDDEFVLEDTKIEKSKLKNIYYFFNLINTDTPEDVKVDFSSAVTMADADQMNIYFVCQKKVAEPTSTYALNFSGTGVFTEPNYYTNGITLHTVAGESSIIAHKNEKRIAKVTVDVYDDGETSFTDTTRLVRLETSKGV